MKKLSFGVALIVSVSAFLVGCQESNGPVSPEQSSVTPAFIKTGSSVPQGVIVLDTEVSGGNGNVHEVVYDLNGTIQYTLTPEGNNIFNIGLGVDATLSSRNGNGEEGKIQSITQDKLVILEETSTYSKAFMVDGIGIGIQLFIEFKVSSDQMQIEKIVLVNSHEFAW